MKIVKHAQDERSGVRVPVQGVLLGLVEDNCLEVTHSFPLPKQPEKDDLDNKFARQRGMLFVKVVRSMLINQSFLSCLKEANWKLFRTLEEHEQQMKKNLSQVSVDHVSVGWYQCSYYGAHINKAFFDWQFGCQNSIVESIVLVYEPEKTSKGLLSLKSYRLSPTMMQLYREQDFSPETLVHLSSKLSC